MLNCGEIHSSVSTIHDVHLLFSDLRTGSSWLSTRTLWYGRIGGPAKLACRKLLVVVA